MRKLSPSPLAKNAPHFVALVDFPPRHRTEPTRTANALQEGSVSRRPLRLNLPVELADTQGTLSSRLGLYRYIAARRSRQRTSDDNQLRHPSPELSNLKPALARPELSTLMAARGWAVMNSVTTELLDALPRKAISSVPKLANCTPFARNRRNWPAPHSLAGSLAKALEKPIFQTCCAFLTRALRIEGAATSG